MTTLIKTENICLSIQPQEKCSDELFVLDFELNYNNIRIEEILDFFLYDIKDFISSIEKIQKGYSKVADFSNIEGNIKWEISNNQDKRIFMSIYIKEYLSKDAKCEIESEIKFEIDSNSIEQIKNGLIKLV